VPWDPMVPVHTAWDLGISDATAIWFIQPVGKMLHVIDYLEASDHGMEFYAKVLRDKPYTYGRHYFPHDMLNRDFSSDGRNRLAMAEQLGLRPAVVVPRGDVADGIGAVRSLFPRFVFDQEKCHEGLQALGAYRREWNETRKTWAETPLHDWSSHGADALRCFAKGYQDQMTASKPAAPARLAGVPDALQWMG
jgi:phage terminase large subunit